MDEERKVLVIVNTGEVIQSYFAELRQTGLKLKLYSDHAGIPDRLQYNLDNLDLVIYDLGSVTCIAGIDGDSIKDVQPPDVFKKLEEIAKLAQGKVIVVDRYEDGSNRRCEAALQKGATKYVPVQRDTGPKGYYLTNIAEAVKNFLN